MAVKFPSVEFFQALADRMNADRPTFEKLGYCDTQMGVRVEGGDAFGVVLTFEVYECTEVRPLAKAGGTEPDFTLVADAKVWKEMLEAIRDHGGADAAHSLNTLSHLGDHIRVDYEDPEGYDKFFRFMATLQAFFDLAADLDFQV